MKRSQMNRGTSQLARTPFKSKMAASTKVPAPRAQRSTLKAKGPKMTPIRKAARGQDCTLRIPGVCNRDPETVVLCHSNALADGKGMGLKAPDTEACFGCSSCHDVLDGRAPRPDWLTLLLLEGAFIRARGETHIILKQKGLM